MAGKGEIDAEGYARMQEALKDPARVDVVVTGRNGFELRFGYPIGEHEDAEVSVETEIHRNELRSGWGVETTPYWEPIPTGRTIVWTVRTKTVRVPEGGF